MTRPTDASIARAFWAAHEKFTESHSPRVTEALIAIEIAAEMLDAESPAGTARGSEEVMTNEIRRPAEQQPIPVARGEEGKTSPLPVATFSRDLYVRCPTCTGSIPVGKHCGGPNCPLRPA